MRNTDTCLVLSVLWRGETRDRELRGLFHVANGLHRNFYENWLDTDDVAEGLEDVERFVEKIERSL